MVRTITADAAGLFTAQCLAGEVATGGGLFSSTAPAVSRPVPPAAGSTPTGWQATSTTGGDIVYVVCVSVS